jgi:SAM-dependent methyltransferase
VNEWRDFYGGCTARWTWEPVTVGTPAGTDFFGGELASAPRPCVLDIGCGTGRHDVELARRSRRVTGADLSPGRVEVIARTGGGVDRP